MTKTATVHAQQRWEFMELTRKTEAYLVNELNLLGDVGWELVTVINHVEAKSGLGSSNVWTAFLKRPSAHAAMAGRDSATNLAAPVIAGPVKKTPSESTEVFGMSDPE